MEREFPPPPRAGLQGSPLLDLLAQLALAERPATPPSFVEGLGRWLGWKEAIPLSAVLQPTPRAAAAARAPAAGGSHQAAAWAQEFQRVQTTLRRAIVEDTSTAREDGLSYLPFRSSVFQQQQAMETAIAPLRTQLRAAVARLSPALARLAALDAVMATALAPREQARLALLPALLEKHFSRLRQTADTDTPWLSRFRHDMQLLLLAELDLRLQPAQGLLATLRGAQPGPEGHHA